MKRWFRTRMRLMGAIAVIALAGFVESNSCRAVRLYCHSEFYRYFQGLGDSEARVNPVERVLFSVLLTTTKPEAQSPRLQEASD